VGPRAIRFYGREGKSPKSSVKDPKLYLSASKEVKFLRQLGGWLKSSNPLKKSSKITKIEILRRRLTGLRYIPIL